LARLIGAIFSVAMVLTVCAHSQETELVVVPATALALPGFDENLWSSEIYVTNPTSTQGDVIFEYALPGYTVPPDAWLSCAWWSVPAVFSVPPYSSIYLPAGSELCIAEQAVGAWVLRVSKGLHVSSRMVNHDPAAVETRGRLLYGFGSEIPGIAIDAIPGAGAHLLHTLVWHPDRCGPRKFDTYVGFANPNEEAVNVVIDLTGEEADEKMRSLPGTLIVPGLSWQQINIRPPVSTATIGCGVPQLFDLRVEIDGPLAIYASVVDRSTQDPRIVLPLPMD